MTTTPSQERLQQDTDALLRMFAQGGTVAGLYGLDESELDALYAFGLGHYNQARYAEASRIFGTIVTLQHGEPRFLNAYASSLQMLGQFDRAIHYFGLSQLLDASDPMPTFHSAECLLGLGWLDDAVDALDLVIQQCEAEPGRHVTLLERARALAGLVETRRAQAGAKAEEA